MKNKMICAILSMLIFATANTQMGYAALKEGASSLLLPTTGQAMNGELGNTKTKIMAGVEVASVATIAVLGVATGGGIVWVGLAPLIGNHLWSSTDAYKSAKNKKAETADQAAQDQIYDAQRTVDLSRQRRYEREQTYRSNLRERLMQAKQEAEAQY